MTLSQNMLNKDMRVKSKGVTYSGKCISFIQAADNDPGMDSIAIELENGACIGFFESEIESIAFL